MKKYLILDENSNILFQSDDKELIRTKADDLSMDLSGKLYLYNLSCDVISTTDISEEFAGDIIDVDVIICHNYYDNEFKK